MDLLESKIIMFGYVVSKPHLTVQEKQILLKYIKEASAIQLNYLLKKGRMLTENEILKELKPEYHRLPGMTRAERPTDLAIKDPKELPPPEARSKEGLLPSEMTAADRKVAADNALHRQQANSALQKAQGRGKARDIAAGEEKAAETGKVKAGEESKEDKVDASKEEQGKEAEETKAGAEEKVKAGEEGSGGQPDAKGNEATLANKARDTAVAAGQKAQEVGKQAYAKGSELAGQAAQKAQEVGQQAYAKGSELAGQASQAVGGDANAAAIAAAGIGAITAGVLAYKRFFSKAARACGGMSGNQKTACMNKYKAQGKKAEIATLNAKKVSCKGNPKCIAKIQARIQKANAEAGQLMASAGGQ
jgi:cell division septum initiation protein DivIVA